MGAKHGSLPGVISIAAALIYNDWPLGYVLNPAVARVGLSSDLEAYGQPFNWFFIGGDLLSALLTLYAVWLLATQKRPPERYYGVALIGLSLFSIMTAVSAVLPLRCAKLLQNCGFDPAQVLGPHDVAGGLAALGLFVGMAATWELLRGSARRYPWTAVLLIAWSLWGLLFTTTSLPAVRRLPHIQAIAVIWQQVFLVLSGMAVVYIVYCLVGLRRDKEAL